MASNYDDEESPEAVCIGTEEEVRREHRKVVEVQGREVVVFAIRDTYYALDRQCYHTGGPLQLGDIEEINGHLCVICPWHKYKISLQTGEGIYQKIDPHDMKTPPVWTSKGVKQRTHNVTVKNGNVYVSLSDLSHKIESDYYYSDEHKQLVWKVPTVNK